MGRILSIDYGRKRCGIAVTDVLQIVPGGLATVSTHTLPDFLREYFAKEPVDKVVLGHPKQMNFEDSESMKYIKPFVNWFEKTFPTIPIIMLDERFTSKIAQRAIIDAGIKKERRQKDKGLVDEVSAVILLQSYMESTGFLK
ncbi:Holliday junction resolvase RuvX [Porphyromonas pogonae]|uniref:Holliday junction resolvase RuvX n=1 Tax=Porphyromonas pogonae TaxID=867595 RepID=UPI002E7844FA|nr:Holliday junction resolvase RuvX [Porphyromonas pogonae]